MIARLMCVAAARRAPAAVGRRARRGPQRSLGQRIPVAGRPRLDERHFRGIEPQLGQAAGPEHDGAHARHGAPDPERISRLPAGVGGRRRRGGRRISAGEEHAAAPAGGDGVLRFTAAGSSAAGIPIPFMPIRKTGRSRAGSSRRRTSPPSPPAPIAWRSSCGIATHSMPRSRHLTAHHPSGQRRGALTGRPFSWSPWAGRGCRRAPCHRRSGARRRASRS